jgi:hypothetical protein
MAERLETCRWMLMKLLNNKLECLSVCYYMKGMNSPTFFAITRESLLEGKDLYGRPPCTNLFRLTAFLSENMYLYFLQKTTILMRRSTVVSLPL